MKFLLKKGHLVSVKYLPVFILPWVGLFMITIQLDHLFVSISPNLTIYYDYLPKIITVLSNIPLIAQLKALQIDILYNFLEILFGQISLTFNASYYIIYPLILFWSGLIVYMLFKKTQVVWLLLVASTIISGFANVALASYQIYFTPILSPYALSEPSTTTIILEIYYLLQMFISGLLLIMIKSYYK